MCKFFSLLSDAKGNYYYADHKLRKEHKHIQELDSHSWLAKHFLKNGAEDKMNAYEFNPLTKVLVKDKLNTEDDSASVEKWCNEIDWKRIVPQLIVKPIVHPFELKQHKPTKKDLANLKAWDSVWASVWASVWNSVRDSVWNSVWNSVWDSVWASVGASVGAYYSSFFDIKYDHDFSCAVALWERGLVPSFDGTLWRLHSGEKAAVVWEGTVEDLVKVRISQTRKKAE